MRTVKINKEELKRVIAENRAGHRAEFDKAVEQYREAVVSELEQMIQRVKDGKKINHYVQLPLPEDHTDEYDQVLEMLGMSVDEDIELTHQEFKQFVRDEWNWKDAFLTASASLTEYNRKK